MSYSNHKKIFKQLKSKPAKIKKFKKHSTPKKRSCGLNNFRCSRCGRIRGHIKSYGLNLCRQCFREVAPEIGFKKYN